ncbi:5'-methylthioadenosine/adenosylhomocysteine nucleosidase [bacterium]|nr:5'-methylthioadenosine/adenosylhomocysteine nucleosidase [bacterium]
MNNKTVGIIGAMDCEVNKLKSKLQNLNEIKHGALTINIGQLHGNNIVLVKSGVGKVNAAMCTQYIIDKYNPDYIVNTGIAGGIASGLKVGDIVVGQELVQYDFDVSAIGYAKGYMCTGKNPDKPTVFYSDVNLIKEFEQAAKGKLNVHTGVIASGDTFVSDKNKKREIKETFNASAVEMEGCAIAQTAFTNGVPFIIVRAISDLADDTAAQDHEFVETEMAELSSSAIEELLKINSFVESV